MAIAFDAISNASIADTGDPVTFTHTPAGTPRGVFVFVTRNSNVADDVVGVTYGGVAMTEVPLSPISDDQAGGSNDSIVHGFFLGSGIPTGAQTVSIDMSASGVAHWAACVSVTADGDTAIEDTSVSNDPTDPSTCTLTTSVTTFCMGCIDSAAAAAGNTNPSAGMTERYEADTGDNIFNVAHLTANPGAGSPVLSWVNGDPCSILGIAIKELASQNAPRSMHYALEGMR